MKWAVRVTKWERLPGRMRVVQSTHDIPVDGPRIAALVAAGEARYVDTSAAVIHNGKPVMQCDSSIASRHGRRVERAYARCDIQPTFRRLLKSTYHKNLAKRGKR